MMKMECLDIPWKATKNPETTRRLTQGSAALEMFSSVARCEGGLPMGQHFDRELKAYCRDSAPVPQGRGAEAVGQAEVDTVFWTESKQN